MKQVVSPLVTLLLIGCCHGVMKGHGGQGRHGGHGGQGGHTHVSPGIGIDHVDTEINHVPHGGHIHSIATKVPHVYAGNTEIYHGAGGHGGGYNGYQSGYMSGYQPGYQSGPRSGYRSGYQSGYRSGYQPRYRSGYQSGYRRGGMMGRPGQYPGRGFYSNKIGHGMPHY